MTVHISTFIRCNLCDTVIEFPTPTDTTILKARRFAMKDRGWSHYVIHRRHVDFCPSCAAKYEADAETTAFAIGVRIHKGVL